MKSAFYIQYLLVTGLVVSWAFDVLIQKNPGRAGVMTKKVSLNKIYDIQETKTHKKYVTKQSARLLY
jgi:hypothetical protein